VADLDPKLPSAKPTPSEQPSQTDEASGRPQLADLIFKKPIRLALETVGTIGGISLLLLGFVGLLFLWMWQTKDWQAYVGAAAGGLGAILGASAGLFKEGEKARWILAIAGGVFTAWVTWYTVSDLSHDLKEKTELADILSGRLVTAKLDSAYYLKLVPQQDLAPVLTEVGWRTRTRFNAAIAKRPFRQNDFETTRDGLDLLESLDDDNAQAHYFRGLIARAFGDPAKGRQQFYEYLNKEARVQPSTREGPLGPDPCKTPAGVCRERTAWVFHLLANDFRTDALNREKADLPVEEYYSYFSDALDHACTAMRLFPPKGFSDPNQLVPTQTLVKSLSDKLGRTCPGRASGGDRARIPSKAP
jgi:hypothetical protein